MANYFYFHTVNLDELARAPAPEGESDTLADWIGSEVSRLETEGDDFDHEKMMDLIAEARLAPGVELIENMGKSMIVQDDLYTIAQGLPGPLRTRFSNGPEEPGELPPDVPADSPLRNLRLPGLQFFTRDEMEAFRREYENVDEELLADPEGEAWNTVFAEHDADEDYDFGLFYFEGYIGVF